jgi:hypothetical protein
MFKSENQNKFHQTEMIFRNFKAKIQTGCVIKKFDPFVSYLFVVKRLSWKLK